MKLKTDTAFAIFRDRQTASGIKANDNDLSGGTPQ